MKSAEGSGRTVEEAIRDALRTLGARREDVDLIVLDEGSRGMLGLGSRSARVRLTLLLEMEEEDGGTPVAEPPAPVRMATEEARELTELGQAITSALIEAMGFSATVAAREDSGQIHVAVTGPDLALLIGRRGQALEALDLLVNLIAAHRQGRRVPVVVDVERYRERRVEVLQDVARRFADRARRTGRPVALKPMSAAERRIVHTTLAEDGSVSTHSEGEDPDRHVVITPRRGSSSGPVGSSARQPGRVGPHTTNHTRQ